MLHARYMTKSFTFKTLDELPRGDSEITLLYGPAGSGKTFFCGTAGPRTFFINIGDGIQTLQSPLHRKLYPDAKGITIHTIHEEVDANGIVKVAKAFDEVCDVVDFVIDTPDMRERFDTIVIDDASSLRRSAMNKALEVNLKTGLSTTKTKAERFNVVQPEMQDYQREMSIIEQMIAGTTAKCKANGMHMIITGHVRQTFKKGEKMGDSPILMRTSPAFTGVDKNPDQITQYFDNVWYTEAISGGTSRTYRIVTQGHEQLAAKTRWAGVFDVVETNLTWLKALERIQNSDPAKKLLGVKEK